CTLDLIDGHDLGVWHPVPTGFNNAVGCNDIARLDVVDALLVLGNHYAAALDLVLELIAVIDNAPENLSVRVDVFHNGLATVVGPEQSRLLAIGDEVALLLRRVETLNHHVQKAVVDRHLRTHLKHRLLVTIHRLLEDEPR